MNIIGCNYEPSGLTGLPPICVTSIAGLCSITISFPVEIVASIEENGAAT
jgi:hypothetical protein